MRVAGGRTAPVNQRDNALSKVLVDPGETLHCDLQSSFFEHFASNAVLEGLVQFEYSAGSLPAAVVLSPDDENPTVIPYNDPGDTDRVLWRSSHRWSPLFDAGRRDTG
ncbi:hypothetical protein A4G30_09745 [Mycobacterium kansasii]|nr:hypothetical protein O982_18770 [Mycobacterium avium 10-5581]ETB27170.1 hypothetical protein O971_17960 [Mycobacterium avium subsp. hominissuis 10-4249]KDO98228.1 hypothetical protein MAVA5_03395 [Mycobacterium avium subsp. hominissuis A5]KZS75259.1 hypothetical protein A4G30_09745 [Mycobacterium kansasii]KZS81178.1 hypothetical protein A4G31_09710 [Mycobacterium persicum]